MEGKLNAYATTMAGRPIVRNNTTPIQYTQHSTPIHQEDKPIIITRNKGLNLWQWLRKYSSR